MRIQHNIMAMSAYRNYTNNVSAMKKNLEKLSSGYKINRAGDDAAGLAISEKMRAQITGLETAQKNAKDGISLVQTAEGALTEVHDMLNRMVELATQSANGTYDNTTDRNQMQKELDQLRSEINRIADSSNFNGIKLLDGSMDSEALAAIEVGTVDGSASNMEEVSDVIKLDTMPGVGSGTGDRTILHDAGGGSAQQGSFKIMMDQVDIGAPASGTAAVNIKIGNATVAIKASASNVGLNGTKIAQILASKAAYIAVNASGTVTIASTATAARTAAGAKGLIYSAGAASSGSVTYTLSGVVNAAGTAATTVTASNANTLLTKDTVASGAVINLNFTINAVGSNGNLTNNTNFGVQAIDTKLKGNPTFGNTYVDFDTAKLEEGMKITIGSQTKTVTLSGASGADIDLSGLDVTNAADAGKIMQKVVGAFKDNASINVGVNSNGKLTLSEKTNANGSSVAASDVQKAMESLDGFKSLLKVEKFAPTQGTTTLTLKDNLFEGNGVTVGSVTYTFTKDPEMQDTATVKYVQLGSSAAANAANLAAKIGNNATASGNVVTVTASGTTAISASFTGENKGLTLQIGDTSDKYNQLNVSIKNMHTYAMGKHDKDGNLVGMSIADISIATQEDAGQAVDAIKNAINYVSDMRGTLGATQNRLDHTINNLSVMTENIQDAESTIRDVDVAEEMMAYTKNNILIQSAQAMLAQANQVPQGVLQLLQ